MVVLLVLALGGGYLYWRVIGGLFTRTDVALDPTSGPALNVLLVGSDSREGLDDPEDVTRFGSVGGRRADTIILAQVVATQQRGVLVHIPRDLWVTVHGQGRQHQGKINSAYRDGPQAVIDTVGNLTGVPINHYMEVDISGFRKMVDAIGGIDVCVEDDFYDSKLNFSLPPGTNHLDGNEALSYVRARSATPDGDFGRIRRQQEFIRSVMSKVGNPSVLGNPVRVNDLARSFARNVTVDQFFQLDDLIRFALSIRRVGPDQLLTYSVPGHVGSAGGQSVVLVNEQEAESLFSALRNVQEPEMIAQSLRSPSRLVQAPGVLAASDLLAQNGPCPQAAS